MVELDRGCASQAAALAPAHRYRDGEYLRKALPHDINHRILVVPRNELAFYAGVCIDICMHLDQVARQNKG